MLVLLFEKNVPLRNATELIMHLEQGVYMQHSKTYCWIIVEGTCSSPSAKLRSTINFLYTQSVLAAHTAEECS